MKNNLFDLKVITPVKELFSGKAEYLVAKAVDGEIGIYAHHAPLISLLDKGTLKIKPSEQDEISLQVSDGILYVKDNSAQILVAS